MRLQDGTGIGFRMIGKYQGFSLAEYDTDEQMQNTVARAFARGVLDELLVVYGQGLTAHGSRELHP